MCPWKSFIMSNFHGVSARNPCQYSLKLRIGKVRLVWRLEVDDACPSSASGDLPGGGQNHLYFYLSRRATGQRPRPAGGGVALAGAPVGAACALRAAACHESHLWGGDRGESGRTQTGSLLCAVFGDPVERSAADPPVAAAPLDRVCLSDVEASVGDRGVSGAQRRRLLWTPGVPFDGECRVVLHVAYHL